MIAWFLLMACSHETPHEAPELSLSERTTWAAVERPDTVPVATLAAEAGPAPSSEVQLGPPASGRILQWHVSPGDEVTADTPLADLASPELSGLQARISSLSSRVRQLRTSADLIDAQVAGGVASRVEAQSAAAEVRQAEAELAGARALLRATGGTAGSGITWTATTAGTVGEIHCPVGPVEQGAACLTIQRDQDVLLDVRIPARHLAALDGPLLAEFHSLDGSVSSFAESGRSPALDRRTRSLLVQFRTDDRVLPGSAGRAVLFAPRDESTVLIPRTALTRIDGSPAVFVGNANAPVATEVTVVGGDDDRVLVQGLQPTDEVATAGVFLLKSLLMQEAL